MAKNLMQVFSRYQPDVENKKFLESAVLFGNMRVDKNARILEVDFSYSSLIPKSRLYKLEADIEKTYSLRSVRLLPKYPQELFSEDYFSEIMYEAYRTNLISKSFLQEYRTHFNGSSWIAVAFTGCTRFLGFVFLLWEFSLIAGFALKGVEAFVGGN